MAKILDIQDGLVDFEEGSYLLLINPEKIPHLVYLQDGRYYSLTYKGIELAYSFLPYLEKLIRLQKKMIFLELNLEEKQPFQVFSDFIAAGEDNTTCFYPIKEIVLPESQATMVFELIPDLYKEGIISSANHLRCDELLDKEGNFELSEYTKEDILQYINALKSKYVEG